MQRQKVHQRQRDQQQFQAEDRQGQVLHRLDRQQRHSGCHGQRQPRGGDPAEEGGQRGQGRAVAPAHQAQIQRQDRPQQQADAEDMRRVHQRIGPDRAAQGAREGQGGQQVREGLHRSDAGRDALGVEVEVAALDGDPHGLDARLRGVLVAVAEDLDPRARRGRPFHEARPLGAARVAQLDRPDGALRVLDQQRGMGRGDGDLGDGAGQAGQLVLGPGPAVMRKGGCRHESGDGGKAGRANHRILRVLGPA